MTDSLNTLESKRKNLFKELSNLGDFRRGTISVNYRKCGKKNCACAKPGHPGHGPQYLWNTTVKRKSRSKNLKPGPELEKYANEIDNWRNFVGICDELAEVSEKICELRPVPEPETADEKEALKKKLRRRFGKKFKMR